MANGNGFNAGGQNNPFGFLNNLDIGQLMNMLGNVDMNQIASIMNNLGINPNNFNPNMNQNANPNMNPNMNQNMNPNMDSNYNPGMSQNSSRTQKRGRSQGRGSAREDEREQMMPDYGEIYNKNLKSYGDKRTEILNAMKPMVDPERAVLLDRIIQLYLLSKIIRK